LALLPCGQPALANHIIIIPTYTVFTSTYTTIMHCCIYSYYCTHGREWIWVELIWC